MSDPAAAPPSQRVDLWLWHARLFKTRSLAARVVEAGHVRLDGRRVDKPSRQVRPGDTLTVALRAQVLVVRVDAIGARRGPPAEARTLYAVVEPAAPPGHVAGPGPAC